MTKAARPMMTSIGPVRGVSRVGRAVAAVLAMTLGAPFASAAPGKPAPTNKPVPTNKPAGTGKPPAAPAKTPARPKPLAETLTGEAKAEYESGKILFRDGDFAGALVKFQSAYDRAKDPRLLWNMAACEKSLRRYARTLALVRRYAAEGGDTLTEQDRSDADELARAIEQLTAALRIESNEAAATVTIDDEEIGKTPLEKPIPVDIGTRRVRVTKEGFVDFVEAITVAGGPEVVVDARLVPVVHEGRLIVEARPGDAIAVDGKVLAVGRFEGALPSGPHTLRVSAAGRTPYQAEVVLQDHQLRTVTVALEAEAPTASGRGGIPTWVWVAGGAAGVAALSVGGYFLFSQEKPADYPKGNLGAGFVEAGYPIVVR